jgi:hypothetical protein
MTASHALVKPASELALRSSEILRDMEKVDMIHNAWKHIPW